MIPYLSHPCLLHRISCFHFIKPVRRRKPLVAGDSLSSKLVRVTLFHFCQEPCHKITTAHLEKMQFYPPFNTKINTNIFDGNNPHVKVRCTTSTLEESEQRLFHCTLHLLFSQTMSRLRKEKLFRVFFLGGEGWGEVGKEFISLTGTSACKSS